MDPVGKSTVMIVEADILVRHPLAEYLRGCGFRVLEAGSAMEARAFISEANASIDAVLADAVGLGEDGFALATWMRANHPKIEVALVGTVDKVAEKAGDLCQEGPALARPYDHKLVLDHIRRLLAARDQRPGG